MRSQERRGDRNGESVRVAREAMFFFFACTRLYCLGWLPQGCPKWQKRRANESAILLRLSTPPLPFPSSVRTWGCITPDPPASAQSTTHSLLAPKSRMSCLWVWRLLSPSPFFFFGFPGVGKGNVVSSKKRLRTILALPWVPARIHRALDYK